MKWRDLKKRVERAALKDYKSRRVIKALKKVAPHIPDEAAADLFISIPGKNELGCVFNHWGNIMVIHVHSTIGQPQSEVDFTVAHEFAHIVLGHAPNRVPPGKRVEKAANKLARKWGFDSPWED